jgi:peroxiredoxin
LELRAYQQYLNEIRGYGVQVVGISPELPDSSLSNVERLELEFEVFSDIGNKVSKEFGLVFRLAS